MNIPSNLIFQRPCGYLVRHGSCEANQANCYRGWIDFALDDEGHQAGRQIQNFFAWERVGRVICSDLQRAVSTAQYIMDTGNVKDPYISAEAALRPWHVGSFAGKKKTAQRLAEFHKYVDDPTMVIPDGESLESFQNRNTILMQLLATPYDGLPVVIVCHTSNICAAVNEMSDAHSDPEVVDIVNPGGIIAVHIQDNCVYFIPRLGAATEDEPLGVS